VHYKAASLRNTTQKGRRESGCSSPSVRSESMCDFSALHKGLRNSSLIEAPRGRIVIATEREREANPRQGGTAGKSHAGN